MDGKPKAAVDVAAGILVDAEGRVLISLRPQGKQQAGWWEFPGGKVDSDERPVDALVRELREELGIAVEAASKLMTYTHEYPEIQVCLHIFKVADFRGQPTGRENQELQWVRVEALTDAGLLPADLPIVDKLMADQGLLSK